MKAVQATTMVAGGCAILQSFRIANEAMIARGSLDPEAFEPVFGGPSGQFDFPCAWE